MDHQVTVLPVHALDPCGPVFWMCSCGSASDEDFTSDVAAKAHYHAVHAPE